MMTRRRVLWVTVRAGCFALLHVFVLASVTKGDCGFPGSPANGTVSGEGLRLLSAGGGVGPEGVVVQYACAPGYVLFGDLQRECQKNATWSGEVPTCDLNLAARKKASQSDSFFNYTADLAVDGQLDTCSFTPRTPDNRWWQVHLGAVYTVAAVAVTIGAGVFHKFTVFVVSLGVGDKLDYEPCGAFDGIFESDTVVLVCNHGQGQMGQLIFIRDDRSQLDYFGLCEVEVFSRRDLHLCGQPETPLHGHSSLLGLGSAADFYCSPGYRLIGASRIACLEGRWNGPLPSCKDISCPTPSEIPHATFYVYSTEDRYLAGTVANYTCEPGFAMIGNGTRICDENGVWSGHTPICEAVDCGPLPFVPHGILVANASSWGTLGMLQCDEGFQQVGEAFVVCGPRGQWLVDNATCRDPVASLEGNMPGMGKENNSSADMTDDVASTIGTKGTSQSLSLDEIEPNGTAQLLHEGVVRSAISGSDASPGVVIGSVVAIIVTLAAIVLIAFLRRRWRSRRDGVSDVLKTSSSPEGSRAGVGLADALYDDVSYSNSGFHSDAPGSSVPDDDDDALYADAGLPGAVGGSDGMRIYDHPAGDDDEPIYYTPVEMNCKRGGMMWDGQDSGHENPVYEPLDASRLDAAIYARVDIEKKKKDREESFRRGRASTVPPVDDGVYENVEYSGGSIVSGGTAEGPRATSLESLSPLPSPRPLPPIPSESSLSAFEAMDNELYSPVAPEEPQDEAQWEKCESIYAAALEPSSSANGATSSSASSSEAVSDHPRGDT